MRSLAATSTAVVPEAEFNRLLGCQTTTLGPLLAALGYLTVTADGRLRLVCGLADRPARARPSGAPGRR
ncbi:MAG: hypothetical protein IPK78_05820 [Rhodospirillales bacterium]|nr:hypothetical protein [Rhodospirillales bacterium]